MKPLFFDLTIATRSDDPHHAYRYGSEDKDRSRHLVLDDARQKPDTRFSK
jgi:hypothetical protein